MTVEQREGRHGETADGAALLALATELALAAGKAITDTRVEAVQSATTKSSPTDPVTEADRLAESIVLAGIIEDRPDDSIIGEEGASRTGTSGVTWYIDPIDGTTNYLYDIPAYAVSIGVSVDGIMTAGTVFNPAAGELYSARLGNGAFRNGLPITVETGPALESALIATGFGYQSERRRRQAAVIGEVLPNIRDIRRIGSAALDLCSVACGRVDAYFELGLNSWDFAAGWLIAAEAGAVCDNLRDGDPDEGFLLAAAPAVHGPLSELLRSLDADKATG